MTNSYPSYIVDAFTTKRFAGNPAAICLIPEVLSDEEYLKISAEFNLSETVFPIPSDPSSDYKHSSKFSLRWFTPTTEVPLCGHGTLATSHVLFNEVGNVNSEIQFETQSGILKVKKDEQGNVEMNFPEYELTSLSFDDLITAPNEKFSEASTLKKTPAPSFLLDVIHCVIPNKDLIKSVMYAPKARFVIVIINSNTTKSEFEALKFDSTRALELHDGSFVRDLHITLWPSNPLAQGFIDDSGEPYNYACRCFGPWDGVNEDPATGSAQCAIAPYWREMTGKKELYALQAFPTRGAQFRIRFENGRVILNGSSVTVMRGEMNY